MPLQPPDVTVALHLMQQLNDYIRMTGMLATNWFIFVVVGMNGAVAGFQFAKSRWRTRRTAWISLSMVAVNVGSACVYMFFIPLCKEYRDEIQRLLVLATQNKELQEVPSFWYWQTVAYVYTGLCFIVAFLWLWLGITQCLRPKTLGSVQH
jgi:hypothetical protein